MSQCILILGAAGRDFHNFNVFFRDNPEYEVIAFTATQIPNITDRRYPADLAGELYPDGIPIEPESSMEDLIRDHGIDAVVFSYSDLNHADVMHLGSRALAAGADYWFLGPNRTTIQVRVPVVAICATRTGAGKSQTSRYVAATLAKLGRKPVVIRHPMPYGDLAKQIVQRFETLDDLDLHDVTIEEREEYEAHIVAGRVVYAGVDYEKIVREAEKEADVIIWDGGNNDLPFYKPDLMIAVTDALRAEHAEQYHPGEAVARMADVVVINKVDTASKDEAERARAVVSKLNPTAKIVEAASPIHIENGEDLRGKKVIVIEDGPTLTHGGMAYGAGWIAAERYGALEIVDPRPFAVGSIRETFEKYPSVGPVLPAMGYGDEQTHELEATIAAAPVDAVIVATPIDLSRVVRIDKPVFRAQYEFAEHGEPSLAGIINEWIDGQ
jgi:predicted GTPase